MTNRKTLCVYLICLLVLHCRCVLADTAEASLVGTLDGQSIQFCNQSFQGTATVTNNGKSEYKGGIYLRFVSREGFLKILDSRFVLPAGKSNQYTITLPGFNFTGGGTLELIYRELPDKDTVLAKHALNVLPYPAPRVGENILVNSSFELGRLYCGTMLGYADGAMRSDGWDGPGCWFITDVDGWWRDHGTVEQITFPEGGRSGGKCLRLTAGETPASVISSLGRYIPDGMYTFTAYVKTKNAAGTLSLDFVTDVRQAKARQVLEQAVVNLPENADDWTRLTMKLNSPALVQPCVRVHLTKGSLDVDDVQLESGDAPTIYNVRPAEFFRISFDGQDDAVMPKWLNTDTQPHTIRLHNDSRTPVQGKVNVTFGPWNVPELQTLGEFDAAEIAPGTDKGFQVNAHNFRADGYVASVRLKDDGDVIVDGLWDFNPYAHTPFNLTNMLHSRSAARLAVVSPVEPKKLFGIGNTTMEKIGALDSRSYIELHEQIRQVSMSCVRGGVDDDETFMISVAGGVPLYAGDTFDTCPAELKEFSNPCHPERIDVYSKEGQEHLRKRGENSGKLLASHPLVAGIQMANEQYWVNGGMPCPTKAADEHFRDWCKRRYGSIEKVNELWGTNYTGWDEVDQVISESFYKKLLATNKSMYFGGLFWGNSWPQEAIQELHRQPGKTMDWFRWRTETGVWAYTLYADAAKKYDSRTLYSTDLPLGNFFKQFFIPFVRAMDAAMINVRYTSGYEISFGVPQECMDNLELAESIAFEQNKPFWGIEVYHQPSWPAESVALQNWGLIAHGMSVPMIFSWYPKSDRGNPQTILEWEQRRDRETGDLFDRACWYMIDADGAQLPAYDAYVRSLREVKRYHEAHDGLSIHRHPTDIAYYISNDSNEYDTLISAASPWGALGQRSCFNLIFLLRLAGITANYVDDKTLPDTPGEYNVVIVPYSKVLSQEAAGKLANFAQAGGRVVLAGLSGQLDPWARKYSHLGGAAWKDLAWASPEYQEEFFPYTFDPKSGLTPTGEESSTAKAGTKEEKRGTSVPQDKLFRGVKFGELQNALPIHDQAGRVVGYYRPWGKGKLIAYGICPDTWCGDPHVSSHLRAWMDQLITLAELKYSGRWTLRGAMNPNGNRLGTGTPVVDLVVRVKSPEEKFVFVLNQGGEGEGLVEIPVSSGEWSAADVVQPNRRIDGEINNGVWSTKVHVSPLGYRVIRLKRMK